MLVTSMQDEVRTIAQHYRDRGDSENNFLEPIGKPAPPVIQYSPSGMVRVANAALTLGTLWLKARSIN
ncbi:MAG: hypothetical protein DMG57_01730 [Acidobacteria bacterium]|nr:MAG: hypothetical protein DMG57_01730 [Acidobacteriota bacterium]